MGPWKKTKGPIYFPFNHPLFFSPNFPQKTTAPATYQHFTMFIETKCISTTNRSGGAKSEVS